MLKVSIPFVKSIGKLNIATVAKIETKIFLKIKFFYLLNFQVYF